MNDTSAAGSDSDSQHTAGSETRFGLEENVAATITYVLGWLTGLIMFFLEKENQYVRFHAAQSIVVFGSLSIVMWILGLIQSLMLTTMYSAGGGFVTSFFSLIFGLISLVLWVGGLILWIYLLVRTYQDRDPRIPVAEGIAESIT